MNISKRRGILTQDWCKLCRGVEFDSYQIQQQMKTTLLIFNYTMKIIIRRLEKSRETEAKNVTSNVKKERIRN